MAVINTTQHNNEPNITTRVPLKAPHHQPTSRLLNLPSEIQHKIYKHLFPRWSLAILSATEEVQSYNLDHTFTLTKRGDYLISGPPGSSLLLASRLTYEIAHAWYGKSCTGRLLLGKIKGKTRRKLPTYLKSHAVFRRFYHLIDTLYVYIALSSRAFHLNFRTLFPSLKFVDCVVHEAGYGPMIRVENSTESFLRGRDADELSHWTQPVVNYFLCSDRRWIRAVHAAQSPWDDTGALVSVKVLGTAFKKPGVILGYNYHWNGPKLDLVALIVRSATEIKYWEADMKRGEYRTVDISSGEYAVPWRFRWVSPSKW